MATELMTRRQATSSAVRRTVGAADAARTNGGAAAARPQSAAAPAPRRYPSCTEDHAGPTYRARRLLRDGDSKIVKSIAGHITAYAIERYGLSDLETDRARTVGEMYHFLVWKLGSPSTVAAQWLTAGYQHFDKGYVDEAAASLLGVVRFTRSQPELKLPEPLLWYLQARVGTTSEATTAALTYVGVHPALAKLIGDKYEQFLRGVLDRNDVGVYWPKQYDVDNRLVELAITARRERAQSPVRVIGVAAAAATGRASLRAPRIRLGRAARSSAISTTTTREYPPCREEHAGRSYRIQRLVKKGDTDVVKSIAGHITAYAQVRYGLRGLVSAADVRRARDEMYKFLSWKFGSPTAVTGQWLSNGYAFFDRGHVDEAAASLLGIVRFDKREPDIKFPEWLIAFMEQAVGESGESVSAWLVDQGMPQEFADQLGKKVEQAMRGLLDRNAVGIGLPKSYDIDNRLVEAAVAAARQRR